MTEITGAQAIIQTLKKHGIDTIFGLPGIQLDHMFDALYHEDSIRVIHTRHEQAAGYMAFGYAESTGKVGVCLVVPGPGLLNASAALSTAYATNTPVLVLAGQIRSDMIDKGIGLLHEVPNQLRMMESVAKWTANAPSPADAPALVHEAFRQLRSGRTRPVVLEMAMDVMGQRSEVTITEKPKGPERPEGDPDLIEKAAKLLGKAENPMIYVGGGAKDAATEVRELAESLQAPVTASISGKGAISDRSYLAQNRISASELWKEADAVLIVGSRMTGPVLMSNWPMKDGKKIVRIDIDPDQIDRLLKPDVDIIADAGKCLNEMIKRVGKHNISRPSREEELLRAKEKSMKTFYEVQPLASYTEVIRQELDDDGIFVPEMTQLGYFSWVWFPVYRPRTFIACSYQGTLGYGFATALGVKVANPDKQVISINGDGGFLFTGQELATALLHKINLVAIIFRDNAYGNVRKIQDQSYGGRNIAVELHNPDFVKYAEAFGATGIRAETPEALRDAIRKGFDRDVPTLIEVPMGKAPDLRLS
jgi:acetolactate synthase-1/2/3 large subunit